MGIDNTDRRKELFDRLEVLIERINDENKSFLTHMSNALFTRKHSSKLDTFLSACIDLQKRINVLEDDSNAIFDIKKEVLELENNMVRSMAKPRVMLVYTALVLILVGCVVFWFESEPGTFISVNINELKVLGRSVFLGIAGAFMYFATTRLSEVDKDNTVANKIMRSASISVRVAIAVAVPVVVVALFFNPDGKIAQVSETPELLSFACGYSSKLVVNLLNKIVEKGQKIIDAL